MIFDSHCHIYDNQFEDVDEIIQRAVSCGVKKLLIPGNTYFECHKAIEIANAYPFVYASVGVHPSEVFELNLKDTINALRKLTKNTKVVAIGEIGLDYHWFKLESEREIQREWFREQLRLAEELKMPVIIHSRDACQDTMKILKEACLTVKVVFHCFSYSVETMKEIINMGWFIGLDGPVTYKNAIEPKEVAKLVPIDRLLLETDSPYLTPTPYRGKRNEPSYITYIAMEIAKLKGMTYDDLCASTYKNTCDFFGVDYE